MGNPIEYDGGLTCSLPVTDIDRSIDWYREMLGFELVYKMDEMGWCEIKTAVDRVQIGLSQVETVKPGPGNATLVFGVKDIQATRSGLESHDIKFDGDTQEIPNMVKLATFFDPDGNTLMLYEELS